MRLITYFTISKLIFAFSHIVELKSPSQIKLPAEYRLQTAITCKELTFLLDSGQFDYFNYVKVLDTS